MATKSQIPGSFNRAEGRALRNMIARQSPADFARALIDELRDIADCNANSDTCKNKTCQLAHAIERGLEGLDALGRKTNKPLRVAKTLRCPHCNFKGKKEGRHGGTFRYLTNQATWREIKTFKDNILTVEGTCDVYPEDPEHDERIECRNCLTEFCLPATIEVEFT